jgi:hypothetical protein
LSETNIYPSVYNNKLFALPAGARRSRAILNDLRAHKHRRQSYRTPLQGTPMRDPARQHWAWAMLFSVVCFLALAILSRIVKGGSP